MKQNKWLRRGLLILIAAVLVGAAVYALLDFPKLRWVDMEMQAWEVSMDGTVQERLTLEVSGLFTNYRQKNDTLRADITTPKDYRWQFHHADNAPFTQYLECDEKLGAFTSVVFAYDRQNNRTDFLCMALDWEAEYLILGFWDDPKGYLVASTDPTATPQEILAHFEWFQVYMDAWNPNG